MVSGLGRIIVSMFAGFFAGIFSLSALSVIYWILIKMGAESLIEGLYINELIEEIVKFAVLLFLFDIILSKGRGFKFFSILLFAGFFGLGFSFFEATLLLLSGYEISLLLTSPFFALAGLHLTSSVLLGIAASSWVLARAFVFSAFFIIFAIILHIYYNIFALNFS